MGTVRENSADGKAWEYLPHDHARSRAYRWGEDGMLGISDDQARLCLALTLWNGADSYASSSAHATSNVTASWLALVLMDRSNDTSSPQAYGERGRWA